MSMRIYNQARHRENGRQSASSAKFRTGGERIDTTALRVGARHVDERDSVQPSYRDIYLAEIT